MTRERARPMPEYLRRIVAEMESSEPDEAASNGASHGASRGAVHGAASNGAWNGSENGTGTRSTPTVVEDAVRRILHEIGEDPDREGLRATPGRVHRMYAELTAGYHVDPERLINGAIFDVGYSEMVVVKGIPFYSLCEHHLLPFFGTAAVAYIPEGRVIGLSKIPRIVDMYARRLQVQERLTQEIADFLMERLEPQGVGVVMEATHLCMAMRGVEKPGATMTTSHVLGLFRSRDNTRAEFFAHLDRTPPAV